MRSFRPTFRGAIALTIAICGLFGAGVQAEQAHARSLRIATLNTHLMPPEIGGDSRALADGIARAICTSDYDVVALSEVWDSIADTADPPPGEGYENLLVDTLAPCGYSHYVKHVETHDGRNGDSGLMIFSRLEFEELVPRRHHGTPRDELHVEGTTDQVEFVRFEKCDGLFEAGWDCQATKGAALVRIADPTSDPSSPRFTTVVFTHLDASGGQGPLVRESQLGQIRDLLDPGVVRTANSELFVVLGDLNVDGNKRGFSEWGNSFGPGATRLDGFFATTMRDAWDVMTSRDLATGSHDRGLTAGGSSTRLDYVLVSGDREPGRCVQHMKLDFAGLSDHLGVGADLNLAAPHCSPDTARDPVAESGWDHTLSGGRFTGRLEHPGSMQWFRFEEGGTWSFGLDGGPDLRLEVYESRNLTNPIRSSGTTSVLHSLDFEGTARTFSVPSPPFYVRVFHPDPDRAAVPYELVAKRHRCTTREDACILEPSQAFDPELPATARLNSDDKAWFQLEPETADSGASQELQFILARTSAPHTGDLTLELLDEAENPIERWSLSGGMELLETETVPDEGGVRRFLTVDRDPAVDGAVHPTFTIEWRTNLAVLHSLPGRYVLQLVCVDETDPEWPGSDEIRVAVIVDGVRRMNFAQDEMDYRDPLSMESLGEIRFLETVEVQIWESDDISSNSASPITITMDPAASQQLEQSTSRSFAGGEYAFHYNLSRRLNHVVGAMP
jgi:endonuclease/exonuclease/phosphatase family metal-dependent hydrolase